MEESDRIPEWSWRWTAISSLMVSLLYLAFVYRAWSDIAELLFLLLPFYCLALAVGIVFSGLPISKPFRVTFISTAPAPLISYTMALLINEFVRFAQAGVPSDQMEAGLSSLSGKELIVWAFYFIILGLIFAAIACFGCLLGLLAQRGIVKAVNSLSKRDHGNSDGGVRAALIGARATVTAGVIGVVGSIIVALVA